MVTRGKNLLRIGAIAIFSLFVISRLLMYVGTRHLVATDRRVDNNEKALATMGSLEALLNDAQTSVGDYLSVADEKTLAPFLRAQNQIPLLLQQVRDLAADDPSQQKQLQVLSAGTTALLQFDQGLIRRRRDGENVSGQVLLLSQRDADLRAVRQIMTTLVQQENGLLAMNSREVALWVSRAAVIEMFLGAGAAGLLLMAYLFIQWDMKEKARVLAAQQQSEEKIRLLLDSTAEAMYGMDLNGVCTFCNPACLEILGYNRAEDVVGKNLHYLTHHTRADGSPYPVEECRGYKVLRDGKGAHVDDEVLWRSDGSSFAAEYWSYPIRHEGKIIGAVITFLDITSRRQSEIKLQQVHDELNAALRASEARALESRQLSNLGDLFQSCETIEEACRLSADILPSILGSRHGALYVTNASRNIVEVAASWNGAVGKEQGFAPEDCWALRRGKLHSVADLHSAPRCPHVVGSGGYVCVPLAAQGETLGVLYIEGCPSAAETEPADLHPSHAGVKDWEPHREELERRAH